jgi:integrase
MDDPETLRSILDADYSPLRGLKPKALNQFQLSLQRFSEHLGHEPTVADLTGIAVQRFLSARKTKVSTATALKDRTHIAALWNHLFRLRRVEVAPAAVLPPMRAPRRVPRAYRDHELARILRSALATHGGIDGRPASIWHASLILAAFETAERVGALLAVEWRDVDLDERTILLRAENRKGAHQDLLRPISPQTVRWLATLRRNSTERQRVWNWDRTPTRLWGHFRNICKRTAVKPDPNIPGDAGLPAVQCRGYHGLRRAAASYIAAAGGLSEAATALGHASASTTQAHYVDQTIAKPTRSHLDMLPHLDIGQEPRDPVADARESALRAGRQAGRDLAARGEPCPARASIDALAAGAGVSVEMVAHYRQGLVGGWAAGQEEPAA